MASKNKRRLFLILTLILVAVFFVIGVFYFTKDKQVTSLSSRYSKNDDCIDLSDKNNLETANKLLYEMLYEKEKIYDESNLYCKQKKFIDPFFLNLSNCFLVKDKQVFKKNLIFILDKIQKDKDCSFYYNAPNFDKIYSAGSVSADGLYFEEGDEMSLYFYLSALKEFYFGYEFKINNKHIDINRQFKYKKIVYENASGKFKNEINNLITKFLKEKEKITFRKELKTIEESLFNIGVKNFTVSNALLASSALLEGEIMMPASMIELFLKIHDDVVLDDAEVKMKDKDKDKFYSNIIVLKDESYSSTIELGFCVVTRFKSKIMDKKQEVDFCFSKSDVNNSTNNSNNSKVYYKFNEIRININYLRKLFKLKLK